MSGRHSWTIDYDANNGVLRVFRLPIRDSIAVLLPGYCVSLDPVTRELVGVTFTSIPKAVKLWNESWVRQIGPDADRADE